MNIDTSFKSFLTASTSLFLMASLKPWKNSGKQFLTRSFSLQSSRKLLSSIGFVCY